MAYKFQFGAATMSGSLVQEEGITTTTLSATGDVDLGNATTDTVTVTGQFDSDLIPSTDSARDLGTSAKQWAEAHIDAGYIDAITVTGTSTLTTVDINGGNIDGTVIGAASVAAGTFAAVAGTTGTYSGVLKTDDTTEATSTTDGSLQTDGGLSVAKSAVIGDDLDLLSDGAILNIGSTSKFTLTDQAANNCVMAASGARLAFGNAGEYISGDGTDLDIISSGDLDITATLVDVTGAGTFSGILKTDDTTDATSKTDGSLQTDGGLSVAKAIYNGTAATFAADSGVVTMGAATALTVSAAGILNVNNATEATSTTDGSLQTDGGLSVAKSAVIGDDLDLLSDSSVLSMGLGSDITFTHDGTTGLTIAATPISVKSVGDLTLSSSTDIVLDAIGGNFEFKDAGTAKLTIDLDTTAGDVDVNLMVDGDDLVFNQFDGTEVMRLTDDGEVQITAGLIPDANDGAYLGTTAKQFSDLFLAEGAVINFDNGDLTLTQTGDALVLAGDGVPKLTATLTNALSKAANSGLGGTTYDASSAVSDWKLDMNTLTAAAVDVALDSVAIIDSSDSNQTRKESIADLVSGMAGTGLSATNGVLSVGAASTPNGIGDANAVMAEGLNYGTATFTAARVWTMLGSVNLSAGDVVRVKAPAGVSTTNTLTITASGAQTFDGESILKIESPYGGISLFYVAADTFVII